MGTRKRRKPYTPSYQQVWPLRHPSKHLSSGERHIIPEHSELCEEDVPLPAGEDKPAMPAQRHSPPWRHILPLTRVGGLWSLRFHQVSTKGISRRSESPLCHSDNGLWQSGWWRWQKEGHHFWTSLSLHGLRHITQSMLCDGQSCYGYCLPLSHLCDNSEGNLWSIKQGIYPPLVSVLPRSSEHKKTGRRWILHTQHPHYSSVALSSSGREK